MSVKNK